MRLIRSCAFVALACALASPARAGAQTFFELGGGWNYLAPAPAGEGYTRGLSIRASLGRPLAPRVFLRLDAFGSQFTDNARFYSYPPITGTVPCAFPGCAGPGSYSVSSRLGIAGLTASALASVDTRGILYVIGGAGLYNAYGNPGSHGDGLRAGVSVGAGVAAPLGARLGAVVEARYYDFFGAIAQPPWVTPITFGLRF